MNSFKKLKKLSPSTALSTDENILFLCKLIKNYLNGTIKSNYSDAVRLNEYKNVLRKLILPINKISLQKRKRLLNQKGSGLLSLLLPILVTGLWKTLNSKK